MNYEGNLCFVVLAGKYRTGKSFLLNRLLDLQGEGVKFIFYSFSIIKRLIQFIFYK